MNTKKILLIIVGLALIFGAIFLITRSNKTPKPEAANPSPSPSKIRIAYISFNKMYSIPLAVAENKELFNKYNLSVDTQAVEKSPVKLLIAGQVDAILNIPFAPLTANIEGANLSWTGTIFSDSPIILVSAKEPQDIKTVSYPAGGGIISKIRTTKLLKELNLNPDNTTLKEVGSEQIAMTTLMEGKVDAIANITKSDWLIFKKKNNQEDDKYRVLASSVEKENLRIIAGIIFSNDFLTSNKLTAENFTKALIEATSWARSNREKASDLLVSKYSIDKDEAEIYLDEYLSVTENITFTPKQAIAEEMLKIIKTTNPKANDYQVDSFISSDIANTLKDSGFLTQFGFK